MDELKEKIEYMIEKCPDKVYEFAKKMYQHEPHLVRHMLETFEDEGHITNKRKYDELIQKVKWANGNGKGERWQFEDIKKIAKIDFSNVDYTEFDYAYLVNMLYAKCCKEFSDMTLYTKLAKCLLEDQDEETKVYKGAYHNKKKSNQRDTQNYYNDYRNEYRNDYRNYDDYEEENRRGRRRYRSEYNDDNYNRDFDNENYENRRHYNSYENRNSFFRQD